MRKYLLLLLLVHKIGLAHDLDVNVYNHDYGGYYQNNSTSVSPVIILQDCNQVGNYQRTGDDNYDRIRAQNAQQMVTECQQYNIRLLQQARENIW